MRKREFTRCGARAFAFAALTNLWVGGSRLDAIGEASLRNPDRMTVSVASTRETPAIPSVAARYEVDWTCPFKRYIGASLQRDVRFALRGKGEQRLEQPADGENLLADRPSTRSAWHGFSSEIALDFDLAVTDLMSVFFRVSAPCDEPAFRNLSLVMSSR